VQAPLAIMAKPCLHILMLGDLGVGKSTTGNLLVEQQHYCFLA
jgi:shikimate kinase